MGRGKKKNQEGVAAKKTRNTRIMGKKGKKINLLSLGNATKGKGKKGCTGKKKTRFFS